MDNQRNIDLLDRRRIFKAFVNICEVLTKVVDDIDIVASNGVFMWKDEGMLTITTFSEKLEKEAIPFLINKYIFNPHTIMDLSKYLEISDIQMFNSGIKLVFQRMPDLAALHGDKDGSIGLSKLIKLSDDRLSLKLDNAEQNELYLDIVRILNDIDINADFSQSVNMVIDTNDDINMSERAVELDIDGFFLRIARSVFVSINKADKLAIRCTPYKTKDNIFLVMTTNCKEKCKLINLFSALRL